MIVERGLKAILGATERVLIIHHWDTDGICSASILCEVLEGRSVDLRTPTIGNYFLTQEDLNGIGRAKHDTTIVVDLSLSGRDFSLLREWTGGRVIHIDHHLQRESVSSVFQMNPIAEGGRTEEFPSTSWILTRSLHRDLDLLTVLGAVGDHEQKVKTFDVFRDIENFMKRERLSFENLLKMVELIDSSYVTGDAAGVERSVLKLLRYKDNPLATLEDGEWRRRAKKVNDEIERQLLTEDRRTGRIVMKEIHSRYDIISSIARRVAWEEEGRIAIVVNRGFFDDRDQIYVRSNEGGVDLSPIITDARSRGYPAGGRDQVVGIVSSKAGTDRFLRFALEYLSS